MSITTYSELQTAVGDWLHRTDLLTNGKIKDFIALAEVQINNILKSQPGEREVDLVTTIGSRFVSLPSDYVDPIALWLTEYTPRDKLPYVLPSELPVDDTPTTPMYWAIDGTSIALDVPSDQLYSLKFRYKAKYQLSDSAPTNWLLTNHPDVYLFGALAAGSAYTRDFDSAPKWEQFFIQNLLSARNKEMRATGLSNLRVDPALTGMTSDIFTG